jgi:rhomboid family protein
MASGGFRQGRFGGGLGGSTFFPPMIKFLLASNIGLYLFQVLFDRMTLQGVSISNYIAYYGYLWPIGSPEFHFWQPITYMFLHAGLSHVLFNMLALWMFGTELENTWGSKKFITYYLLCGLGGAAAHMFISPLLGLQVGPLVGASGAVFGLLAAFGLLYPDRMIYFYFFIPIRAKYFVLLYLGLELYLGFQGGDNIGHFAHLGGAVAGMIYMIIDAGGPQLLGRLRRKTGGAPSGGVWRNFSEPAQPKHPTFVRHTREDGDEAVEAEYYDLGNSGTKAAAKPETKSGTHVITQDVVDRILDKIAASGYQNLTKEEREILFEASRKMDEKKH